MEQTTKKRHEIIYKLIWEEAWKNHKNGIPDYATRAIKDIAEKTGYAESYLRDIYYKKME